jgi:hypothetical protein
LTAEDAVHPDPSADADHLPDRRIASWDAGGSEVRARESWHRDISARGADSRPQDRALPLTMGGDQRRRARARNRCAYLSGSSAPNLTWCARLHCRLSLRTCAAELLEPAAEHGGAMLWCCAVSRRFAWGEQRACLIGAPDNSLAACKFRCRSMPQRHKCVISRHGSRLARLRRELSTRDGDDARWRSAAFCHVRCIVQDPFRFVRHPSIAMLARVTVTMCSDDRSDVPTYTGARLDEGDAADTRRI